MDQIDLALSSCGGASHAPPACSGVRRRRLTLTLTVLAGSYAPAFGQTTAKDWIEKGNALMNDSNYNMASNGYKSKEAVAIEAFDKAIKLDPNNSVAWERKGVALMNDGFYEDQELAIEAFNKVTELDPNNSVAWKRKGDLLLNKSSYGNYGDAIDAYNRSIRLDPNSSVNWERKGNALLMSEKDNESIQSFDKAIELDPKDAVAWLEKGWALNNLNKYNESIQAYDRAIELNPKYDVAWINKGFILSVQGKYDEAIKAYDKAIEINPLDGTRWDDKAKVQKKMGITTTYFVRDFFTIIDGKGVTFFLSFVDKDSGAYVTPEGKLLFILYKKQSSEIFTHIYDIKKEDYDSYKGGVAIKKWISFEEMSVTQEPNDVVGQFYFQDTKGAIAKLKEEK